MTRLAALCLVGCAVCAGLIVIEFASTGNVDPSFEARLSPAETPSAPPEIRKSADQLFSSTQSRPEAPSSADDADSALRDVRLTGIVIEADRRIAIFAVTGGKPLAMAEGEVLRGWRLDSISAEKVSVSVPNGTRILEPTPDTTLVRPPPPVAVGAGQPAPDIPSGAWGQPVSPPIAVGYLPTAIPVQPPSGPYYFPEYYAGYDQDYPSFNYAYPYPYFTYAIPVRAGFGFFHRHDVHRGGFHSVAFHGGGRSGHR